MLHGEIIQGTTPTQVFELPFKVNQLKDYSITYSQKNQVILKKKKEECTEENENRVSFVLTQQETLLFDPTLLLEVQMKAYTVGGQAVASDIYQVGVRKVLDKEVFD